MSSKKDGRRDRIIELIIVLVSAILAFVGMVLCDVLWIFIFCLIGGFDGFFTMVADLPYLIYLLISVVGALIIMILLCRKKKSE